MIVEDNQADVFLIRESIESIHLEVDFQVLRDGEQAVRLFDQIAGGLSSVCPDVVILDLNLPKIPGRDVLHHIRQSRPCAHTIVIVVTSSNSERDRDEMAQLGVSAYFRKPSDYAEFMKLGGLVKNLLAENQNTSS